MAKGKIKVHSLTGRITSKLVFEAWRTVRRNRGAAGIDKVSIQMFQKNLEANLDRLMRELKQGTFQPLPARRVYIPRDAKGTKFRPLGISAVRDRVAQEVLRRFLNPIFEARFHVALNVLDWHLHKHGFRFVRYADDFVVLCRSECDAKEALAVVERLIADRLGLSLSPEKTKISRFHEGFTFLGFDIKSRFVRMRAKSVENFKTKVRQITRRSYNLDAEMIVKLNRVIRGTANYFATPWSHCGDLYRTLDRWIRMRLRCMNFERKSPKYNVRPLLKHLKRLGLLSLCDIRADCVMGS